MIINTIEIYDPLREEVEEYTVGEKRSFQGDVVVSIKISDGGLVTINYGSYEKLFSGFTFIAHKK